MVWIYCLRIYNRSEENTPLLFIPCIICGRCNDFGSHLIPRHYPIILTPNISKKPAGMDWKDRRRVSAVLLKKEGIKSELIMPATYKILELVFKDNIPSWES